jgi:hypothetical protein
MANGKILDIPQVRFIQRHGNKRRFAPSFWQFEIQEDRVARCGYVSQKEFPQVDNTTGAVANVNLLLPKANAMFYGRFTNHLGAPFANVRFEANDGQNSPTVFKGNGFSDANGYYAEAVSKPMDGIVAQFIRVSRAGQLHHQFGPKHRAHETAGLSVKLYRAKPRRVFPTGQGQRRQSGRRRLPRRRVSSVGQYSSVNALTDSSGNYRLRRVRPWGVHFTPTAAVRRVRESRAARRYDRTNIPPTNAVLNITVYPTGTAALSAPERIPASQSA